MQQLVHLHEKFCSGGEVDTDELTQIIGDICEAAQCQYIGQSIKIVLERAEQIHAATLDAVLDNIQGTPLFTTKVKRQYTSKEDASDMEVVEGSLGDNFDDESGPKDSVSDVTLKGL